MGGNIKAENTRINLLMSSSLKGKIQYYGKMTNRTANSVVLRILEDAIEKRELPDYFKTDLDVIQNRTARMNLVVPKEMKEKLNAEATEKGRSLNNYICAKLLIFFEDIWPDSL